MNIFTMSFVALLVLKLAEVAAISWWVVFSPLILAVLIPLVMGLIAIAMGAR